MVASVTYTPPQVAEMYGVSPEKIVAWIKSGELRALNFAASVGGKRPRYRISLEALEAFEDARAATPKRVAPKKENHSAGVKEFF